MIVDNPLWNYSGTRESVSKLGRKEETVQFVGLRETILSEAKWSTLGHRSSLALSKISQPDRPALMNTNDRHFLPPVSMCSHVAPAAEFQFNAPPFDARIPPACPILIYYYLSRFGERCGEREKEGKWTKNSTYLDGKLYIYIDVKTKFQV